MFDPLTYGWISLKSHLSMLFNEGELFYIPIGTKIYRLDFLSLLGSIFMHSIFLQNHSISSKFLKHCGKVSCFTFFLFGYLLQPEFVYLGLFCFLKKVNQCFVQCIPQILLCCVFTFIQFKIFKNFSRFLLWPTFYSKCVV